MGISGTDAQEAAVASDFVVLSHREPYAEHEGAEGETLLRRKTNGVFTTLDSVMRQERGTWIAWKERVGEPFPERIRVPDAAHPEAYTVRRIPLEPDEARRFYYDFTSTALWPVLFSLLDRARFTSEAWETYVRVNAAFARATCEEAAPNALVWVNDFHLMLAPRMIKEQRPDLRLALFLHTTFPPPDVFGILPWREQLLDGLLHLDLIGFHIPSYAQNFADTASRFMDAHPTSVTGTDLIAHGPAVAVPRYPLSVRYGDREVGLGVYPVGVDVEYFAEEARRPDTRSRAEEVRERTGAETIILAAERLDYVKGVLERLECFERYLHRHPERHSKVSFIQIAVPTRTGMEEFQEMRRQVEEAVGRINGRFGTMDWQPVVHLYGAVDRPELVAFYLAADIAWVTPLRDGLNLVAKEYIATRAGADGTLILSEFAGAAAELEGVILTNPYAPDDMDRALEKALALDPGERASRMLKLRDRVLSYDVHRWSRAFLNDAERAGAAAGFSV
ncbi:MAG: alpha,alpha-trehalose-phosphate synthase (UDP-forming) [Longimicrobiales bacterium]